jgi:GNAT superfamily N-acetyltransferase
VTVRVRPARPGDASGIDAMIRALAEYERAADQVEASRDDLSLALFGPDPAVFAHVAEVEGEVVGFALWYVTYSTWTGRHGMWVEDLFVLPSARRQGAGRALFAALAQECVRRGYRRLEWWVLDWNTPALDFYRALGASAMDEWTVDRLDGDALSRLAAEHPEEAT